MSEESKKQNKSALENPEVFTKILRDIKDQNRSDHDLFVPDLNLPVEEIISQIEERIRTNGEISILDFSIVGDIATVVIDDHTVFPFVSVTEILKYQVSGQEIKFLSKK